MSGKHSILAAWLSVAVLIFVMAACNKHGAVNQPVGSPQQTVAYTQIDPVTSGTVTGTIHFTGKAPAPIAIDMAQDPACGLGNSAPNMTQQYSVRDGRLANVFVYVKDCLGNRAYMPTKAPVILDQKGCRYVPHVVGVMVGQPVEFRNSDPTMHNVHIVPPGGQDAAGFDISQAPMGGAQQHIFDTAGLMIPVRCNNHPWMEAFLNVVTNPFLQ